MRSEGGGKYGYVINLINSILYLIFIPYDPIVSQYGTESPDRI